MHPSFNQDEEDDESQADDNAVFDHVGRCVDDDDDFTLQVER